MRRSILSIFFVIAVLFILIAACAKISSPSGGIRDRIPPVPVKSVPVNGAKNFKSKTLSVTFDEYVVLDKISEKLMVSPPLKKKPRVFLKGKSVITEFDEDLKDSTTYTFYYQDGIKDLNEGNVLENFKVVFSTGPVIDSLSVTGNVYNSLNLEVPQKTSVLMYKEIADSAVVKHLPEYISMIDQFGYFRIDNVKVGKYRLYALKDVDNSKNYNLAEEEFAFMDAPIEVSPEKNLIPVVKDTVKLKSENTGSKETKGIKGTKRVNEKEKETVQDTIGLKGDNQLILYLALKKNHYLAGSSRSQKYFMLYALSLPPDTMKFDLEIPGSGENSYILERSIKRDTLKVWIADSTIYSKTLITTIVKYPFTDSVGKLGYKKDSVQMRFVTPRVPRGTKVKKTKFAFETNIKSGVINPGQNITFKSQTPFSLPDTSRIRLFQVLDSTKIRVPFTLTIDSATRCRYIMNSMLLPAKKYLLIADSASFGNIYNEYTDSTAIKFSVRDLESFCKLTLNISNVRGNTIIQLLNKSEKLIAERYINKDGTVVFPLLESETYRIRAIFDLNGDRKWTTGDFFAGRQPEPVAYYPDEIYIKTNFEITNNWVIGPENYKEQKLKEKIKKKTKKL
jgi:hypothetical protein